MKSKGYANVLGDKNINHLQFVFFSLHHKLKVSNSVFEREDFGNYWEENFTEPNFTHIHVYLNLIIIKMLGEFCSWTGR
jgi:hypothetical protein